jgi:hypothetical protein
MMFRAGRLRLLIGVLFVGTGTVVGEKLTSKPVRRLFFFHHPRSITDLLGFL